MMQSPMFPVMLSEKFECQRLKSWMRPQTSSLHLLLTLRPRSSMPAAATSPGDGQRWVILAAPSTHKTRITNVTLFSMDRCAPWNT